MRRSTPLIPLAGIVYLFIGRAFAWPTTHAQAWRYAAWIASGVVFAAHIAYEHFKLRHSPRSTAFNAALGVAVGAFGLAVVGMLHSLGVRSRIAPTWYIALVAWPAFTAVPAFLAALVTALVLQRIRPAVL